MALPLPVTEQPIETPFARPLLARRSYNIEGDTAPEVHHYFSGEVHESSSGFILTEARAQPPLPAEAAGKTADFFQGSGAGTSADFFIGRVFEEGLQITFTWSDLSSYFWFTSFTEDDRSFEEEAHKDFFGAAGDAEVDDYFGAADPISLD